VTQAPLALRSAAEALAGPLPPLLADAEHLASTVIVGEHGRRRAGQGDTFWQYRPAQYHDERRFIDWRRSARSDAQFVQDREWQIAQSVQFWVDQSASMGFTSLKSGPTKVDRARILALACASLLLRAGERVGLSGTGGAILAPGRGSVQMVQMATLLSEDRAEEFGSPDPEGISAHGRAVFVSDFLGDLAAVTAALGRAADRDVRGVLLQVLDPAEEAFPFDGRTIFESMTGAIRHETRKAGDLRTRYLDRLAERKARLQDLARECGWQFHTHHTDTSAASELMWLYSALERRR